jgi:hypothetical protein
MRYRDRDIDVTTLPVLVNAFPYEKRDGRIIGPGDDDIAVRILPLTAVEGIFDPKRGAEINREFNQAFKTVSEEALNELKALVFLITAIQTRSRGQLREYVKRKAPMEAARAEKHMTEVLAQQSGGKPTLAGESEKVKYLENAVRSLFRRIRFPLSELSRQLNTQARHVQFVLWWVEKEERFAPGLYCDNMATALAAALFSRIESAKGMAVCQRCGNPFTRTKRAQRFCSLRCGNADRKARERAKHRKSKQKRGKQNGTL